MADQYLLEDDSQQRDRAALLAQMQQGAPAQPKGKPFADGTGAGMATAAGSIAGGLREKTGGDASLAVVRDPKPGVFQSDNRSLGGYLQEAAAAYRPELIKLQGDADRKAAAEKYIRSLEPELRARGWTGGDIRNEKIQVDGRWKDLYRGIEDTADAQYLDVQDDGPAAAMGNAVGTIGAGPSSFQSIQSLLPTDTSTYNTLQAKLQQLLGPEATDREALMRMMVK